MKITLLVGISGSGKSTWAKEFVSDRKNNTVRVNKDELRLMSNTVLYDWRNEDFIEEAIRSYVKIALEQGINVILDNLNLSRKHYNFWLDFCKKNGYDLEVKIFDVPLNVCVARDGLREKSIGAMNIIKQYETFKKNWYVPKL